jgi:aerobic carbon-monoxide dehydrogenase medium subunit
VEFVRATSVEEASGLLADDPFGSKLIAGGTALVLMMKHRLVQPDRLVSIADVEGLTGVDVAPEHLTIRGSTSITDAAADAVLQAEFPGLATALRAVGNVRIRNAATVAGNVAEADYASDPPAVLVALGAEALVQGPDGARTAPITDLITGFYSTSLDDGEIITGVRIPRRPGQRSTYLKYRSRSTEDRPCVGVAAAVRSDAAGVVTDCSVVVWAAGPRPQHFPDLTGALVGRVPTDGDLADVAAAYSARVEAMDDQRGSAWYRTRMVEVHVRRALQELLREERR